MKKVLMMAVAVMALTAPAMANDTDHTEMLRMKVEKKFAEADTNNDGQISKSEHEAKTEKMFSETDTNSDGSLSKEEVTEGMKKEWAEKKAMKK